MPTKIVNLKIDEISTVDKPANDKEWLTIKRASSKGGDKDMEFDEALESLEEDVKKTVEEKIDSLEKRIEELSDKDESDEIDKSELSEKVKKRLEAAEEKAKTAEEVAKAERKARRKVELRKEASNYKALANVEDLVEILEKADDQDYKESLVKVFDTVKERLEKADLFKEEGDSGDDSGDSEIMKRAQSLMENDADLTKEQAITKAVERNPELYKEYLSA